MNLKEIKEAIKTLSLKQRKDLLAHLFMLDRRASQTLRRNLARKIDDKNPDHWVSLDVARMQLTRGSPRPAALPSTSPSASSRRPNSRAGARRGNLRNVP
jgi:hypothetical protein